VPRDRRRIVHIGLTTTAVTGLIAVAVGVLGEVGRASSDSPPDRRPGVPSVLVAPVIRAAAIQSTGQQPGCRERDAFPRTGRSAGDLRPVCLRPEAVCDLVVGLRGAAVVGWLVDPARVICLSFANRPSDPTRGIR
jgi:hypothetical protein